MPTFPPKPRALTVALLLASPAALAGQDQIAARYDWTIPAGYRELQVRQQETQRKLLLQMADSMPERLYRDAAHAGQRHFAAQLHHVAAADVFVVGRYIAPDAPQPVLPDTTSAFADRAGLKAYINGAYDWAVEVLRRQPEADRGDLVFYFGQRIPKWLVWDELNQHALWTIGQVVGNFRKHGMAPPGFSYF